MKRDTQEVKEAKRRAQAELTRRQQLLNEDHAIYWPEEIVKKRTREEVLQAKKKAAEEKKRRNRLLEQDPAKFNAEFLECSIQELKSGIEAAYIPRQKSERITTKIYNHFDWLYPQSESLEIKLEEMRNLKEVREEVYVTLKKKLPQHEFNRALCLIHNGFSLISGDHIDKKYAQKANEYRKHLKCLSQIDGGTVCIGPLSSYYNSIEPMGKGGSTRGYGLTLLIKDLYELLLPYLGKWIGKTPKSNDGSITIILEILEIFYGIEMNEAGIEKVIYSKLS